MHLPWCPRSWSSARTQLKKWMIFPFLFFFFNWVLFLGGGVVLFSRAAPAASGGSQARGLIRAVDTGLHRSHSNRGSKPHLRPTPQLTATPDP